ncbi:hypothetical protein ACM66Z_06300 [Sulfurovum sp. ST-21]|uniref:Uncharacterized protein n=1 Tax=Sulfurovum indicum TaxID=2779528 RepID=A0A7M1S0X7_9BACT|nr:hypothetical protein [Sulfurovum indicum]QOR61068.1 hypothetical protein IMZ28_06255 [Sulfurovum indicum]
MQYVYMINNKNIVSDIKFGTIDTFGNFKAEAEDNAILFGLKEKVDKMMKEGEKKQNFKGFSLRLREDD